MQVSIETTSGLGRRIMVEIPSKQLQQEFNKGLQAVSKNLKVDGFRQGHAPRAIVERRFGAQVKQDTLFKLAQTSLQSALESQDLKPAGQVEIEHLEELPETVKVTAVLEVYPQIDLVKYGSMRVQKPVVDISDADIDKALNKLREQFGTWEDISGPAALGHQLTLSYVSRINGAPYEGSDVSDFSFVLGHSNYLKGFEEALIGSSSGELKELSLTYPLDWRTPHLRGKTADFSIELKRVQAKVPAKIDADFAEKIGVASEDSDAVHLKIKESLEKECSAQILVKMKENMLDEMLKQHDFALPQRLVDADLEEMHHSLHQGHETEHQTCQHDHGELEQQARKRVAIGLLLSEVIKRHDLKLDYDKVHARILNIGKSFGHPEMVEKVYYEHPQLLNRIQMEVLFDQAVDYLLSQVQLENQAMALEDLFVS